MSTVLILGYGRAGKRHAKIAEYLGLDVITVDPVVEDSPYCHFRYLDEAIQYEDYDYIVVATPPDNHLEYIEYLAGIPTLCEKPLCGLGQEQLDWANRLVQYNLPVMIGFNYEYHEALNAAKLQRKTNASGWAVYSHNYREGGIPEWGLLLDHVSHAVDTVRFMSGGIQNLNNAYHDKSISGESWILNGNTVDGPFEILECLWTNPQPRIAKLECPYGDINIDVDPNMYHRMWHAFLREEYRPGLHEGLIDQLIIQQANDMDQLRES